MTNTPPGCAAVAGSANSIANRRSLTASASQTDSDRKNCNRCTAACCAPATGSAPANAVNVLLRSRGANNPVRYSRNPRRCANDRNNPSNRAAYASNGPGAGGTGRRAVIQHLECLTPTQAYHSRSDVNKLPVARRPGAPGRRCHRTADEAQLPAAHSAGGLRVPVVGERPMRGFFVQDGRNSAGRVAHPWICLAAAGPGTAGIELIGAAGVERGYRRRKGAGGPYSPRGVCVSVGVTDTSLSAADRVSGRELGGEPREGLHR